MASETSALFLFRGFCSSKGVCWSVAVAAASSSDDGRSSSPLSLCPIRWRRFACSLRHIHAFTCTHSHSLELAAELAQFSPVRSFVATFNCRRLVAWFFAAFSLFFSFSFPLWTSLTGHTSFSFSLAQIQRGVFVCKKGDGDILEAFVVRLYKQTDSNSGSRSKQKQQQKRQRSGRINVAVEAAIKRRSFEHAAIHAEFNLHVGAKCETRCVCVCWCASALTACTHCPIDLPLPPADDDKKTENGFNCICSNCLLCWTSSGALHLLVELTTTTCQPYPLDLAISNN